MRKISKFIIHCTATKKEFDVTVEDLRKWHVEERGWKDIDELKKQAPNWKEAHRGVKEDIKTASRCKQQEAREDKEAEYFKTKDIKYEDYTPEKDPFMENGVLISEYTAFLNEILNMRITSDTLKV